MAGISGRPSLEELASVKERELCQLRLQQAEQAEQAEHTITNLQRELHRERECTCKLEADFDYNLSILDSRDEELAHYESAFKDLKRVVNALVAENSELKVRLDGACKELDQSKAAQLELKAYYQARIKEIHSRMDSYRRTKQSECDAEQEKVAGLQAKLERRLVELEQEAQCQHDQLLADFDQILKQRDREHQARVETISSAHLAQESKCLRLDRELRCAQSSSASLQEDLEGRLGEAREQARVQTGEVRRLEGEVQVMEDRVRELEQCRSEFGRKKEEFLRKHAELDRVAREREAGLKAAKELHSRREQSLVEQCQELQHLVEQREEEWVHREAGLRQAVGDKEQLLQRAHSELAACKSSFEEQVKDFSRTIVEKDLEVQAAKDIGESLRRDLHDRDAELNGVRGKLSQSVERVRSLELSHAQQRLDWEGRCREAERTTSSKQEQALKQLTEANHQLTLECQELRQKLSQQADTEESTRSQRDAALATLHQHGLSCDVAGHVSVMAKLRAQNEEFRNIIKQMRAELEQLSDWSAQRGDPSADSMPTADYVRYMEGEVRTLKTRNRDLAEQLQQAAPLGKPPTPNSAKKRTRSPVRAEKKPTDHTPPSSPAADTRHRNHLIALSDTIASLHREKTVLESKALEWRKNAEILQERLKEEEELVYLLKARHTPQMKLHEKLIQATHVIIALVREKEQLTNHVQALLGRTNHTRRNSVITVHQSTQTLTAPSPRPRTNTPRTAELEEQPICQPSSSPLEKATQLDENFPGSACGSPGQARLDTDLSLASLKFTETSSSLDGMSLEQLVEVLDKNLVDLSPAVVTKRKSEHLNSVVAKGRVRHSTPDSTHELKLVGKEMKTHPRRR